MDSPAPRNGRRERPPAYTIRLGAERRAAWDKAAFRNGLPLSTFIMATVDRRARYNGGLEEYAGPGLAHEPPAAEGVEELAAFPAPAPEPEPCRHPAESRRLLGWASLCACGEVL